MLNLITSEDFHYRLRKAVSMAWQIFIRKAGHGLIPINKEASMQLQYAYILKQILPLIVFKEDESVEVELETGLDVGDGTKIVDLLLKAESEEGEYSIAVEMKCYKKYAASGRLRGATDIFMKDVYEDLRLLELYIDTGNAHRGVSLVMNDLERLVNPKNKHAKCWTYDISDNTHIADVQLATPVGGKEISIRLRKAYRFEWEKHGSYWFVELEGR